MDVVVDSPRMFHGYAYALTPEMSSRFTDRGLAIIIGCSPAFAIFIRNRINGSKKASSDAHGYLKQSNNEDFKLKSLNSQKSRPKRENMDAYWDDAHSSQEELAKNAGHGLARTREYHDEEQLSGTYRN
jgi:hypothetical protein